MKIIRSIAMIAIVWAGAAQAVEPVPTGSFAFTFETELPAPPATAWAAATGDITGWWDHSMSEAPHSMVIEPRPGGRFLEEFSADGDGVVHADVTYAKTGEMLRMVGPMGLAGCAIHMITTWTFAAGESDGTTQMTVEVRATGEIHEGWDALVEKTWRHFIEERLAPFLAGDREGR